MNFISILMRYTYNMDAQHALTLSINLDVSRNAPTVWAVSTSDYTVGEHIILKGPGISNAGEVF